MNFFFQHIHGHNNKEKTFKNFIKKIKAEVAEYLEGKAEAQATRKIAVSSKRAAWAAVFIAVVAIIISSWQVIETSISLVLTNFI